MRWQRSSQPRQLRWKVRPAPRLSRQLRPAAAGMPRPRARARSGPHLPQRPRQAALQLGLRASACALQTAPARVLLVLAMAMRRPPHLVAAARRPRRWTRRSCGQRRCWRWRRLSGGAAQGHGGPRMLRHRRWHAGCGFGGRLGSTRSGTAPKPRPAHMRAGLGSTASAPGARLVVAAVRPLTEQPAAPMWHLQLSQVSACYRPWQVACLWLLPRCCQLVAACQ